MPSRRERTWRSRYRSREAHAAGAATESRSAREWAAARQCAISLASCPRVARAVSSTAVAAIECLRLAVSDIERLRLAGATVHRARTVVVARPDDDLRERQMTVRRSAGPAERERERQAHALSGAGHRRTELGAMVPHERRQRLGDSFGGVEGQPHRAALTYRRSEDDTTVG